MATRKQVILRAVAGKVLTQASETDITKRIFAREVWLGDGDSAQRYKEIPMAEAEALKVQQRQAREAARIEREKQRNKGSETQQQ